MKKEHTKEVSALNARKYDLSLQINPYKDLAYKETLREIRELDKMVK